MTYGDGGSRGEGFGESIGITLRCIAAGLGDCNLQGIWVRREIPAMRLGMRLSVGHAARTTDTNSRFANNVNFIIEYIKEEKKSAHLINSITYNILSSLSSPSLQPLSAPSLSLPP